MTMNVLRKDIKFIENGIKLSNILKKESAQDVNETSKQLLVKNFKKLRMFLRKHRDIQLVKAPCHKFSRMALNKTRIDTTLLQPSNTPNSKGKNKASPTIMWSLELVFKVNN